MPPSSEPNDSDSFRRTAFVNDSPGPAVNEDGQVVVLSCRLGNTRQELTGTGTKRTGDVEDVLEPRLSHLLFEPPQFLAGDPKSALPWPLDSASEIACSCAFTGRVPIPRREAGKGRLDVRRLEVAA